MSSKGGVKVAMTDCGSRSLACATQGITISTIHDNSSLTCCRSFRCTSNDVCSKTMDYESLIKNPPKKRVKPTVVAFQETPQRSSAIENSTTDRNRQIALHHARRIQDRKDLEARIFQNLEELIDFPTSENTSQARPSPHDLCRFRSLINPFQVSDYDALIEERQAASKCAYVFCPNPLKKDTSRGAHLRLVWGRDELKVVPSQKYETWCSKACAKQAMFIKVQLSETPAWERVGASSPIQIELLEETDAGTETSLQAQMSRLTMERADEGELRDAREQLALERGESTTSAKVAMVMRDDVKENIHVSAPKPPSMARAQSGGSIEGYLPRTGTSGTWHTLTEDDESEDKHDEIEDLEDDSEDEYHDWNLA